MSAALLFYTIITLSILSNVSFVDALMFRESPQKSKFAENMGKIFLLFDSYQYLCVLSKSEDVLNEFITGSKQENKTFLFKIVSNAPLDGCVSVVILDMTDSKDCLAIVGSGFKTAFYFIHYFNSPNLSDLNHCFSNTLTPELLVISVREGSVFELSPEFFMPRSLVQSSITTVIKHREEKRKINLRGANVTIATFYLPPLTIYNNSKNLDSFDGIEVHIAREVARHLNFRIRYHIYNNTGLVQENGVWSSGAARALQEGTADVMFGNVWQLPFIYPFVDFGPSLSKNHMSFLVRRPKTVDFNWNSFRTIFQPVVWLAIFGTFVAVLLTYWVGINWYHGFRNLDWGSGTLMVFGHLVMMTSETHERTGNPRLTLTCWSLFSLLIMTTLSSVVVTRLTAPHFSARIDTVSQMLDNDYYWTAQWYARFNSHIRKFLFNEQNPLHKRFVKKYKFMGAEEVSQKVDTDEKLTFPSQIYGDKLLIIDTFGLHGHKALRKFRRSKEVIVSCHVTFGLKKHSPLLKPLTLAVLTFQQAGLPFYWRENVLRRWPDYDTRHLFVEQDKVTFGKAKPLRLQILMPIFYLLLFGLGIASVVFLVEITW